MHFLYIIYSPSSDNYFIGETSNVPARLELHNSHRSIKTITGAASDWQLKLIYKCRSREEAASLAKMIQNRKSRKFTEEVIAEPEILDYLLRS